MINLRFTSYS